ncbi:MAG: glycosyltransferase family 39 protein [Terracidiphilus sp.]|jgi:4-amino-4-deoxy-L-arabinose transferase-like glycosyltransferase
MSTRAETAPSANSASDFGTFLFPALLTLFVLVSRILCRGPLYFADGPGHIASIQSKTYIIQPPGYWLFDRTAGLFSDPALAITVMNILFSVAGVVAFYYTACFFTSRINSFLAALAYATIFYIWFSGEIHSTYASQILFPVGTYYLLLSYERDRSKWMLWLAALIFAVGAGLRPTDGMFLIPMVLYFAVFRMPRKAAFLFLSLITVLCLGWLIPTWVAFERYDDGVKAFATYVTSVSKMQSVLTGVRMYTLANPVRYVLPLVIGFWPVLALVFRNALRNRSDWRVKSLLVWIVPGSLFFILSLMVCAPYLDFLTAAILLLAVSAPSAWAGRLLIVTAVWNSFVFLALGPIPSQRLSVNVVNGFVLRCTRGGIEQRYNTILSDMQHLDTPGH